MHKQQRRKENKNLKTKIKDSIKKVLKIIREDSFVHYIIIIAVALIASIPLINLRIFGTDDGFVHILRIIGTDKIIKSGQFPPLIYSYFGNGFGYAVNMFYGPLVTYGPLIFKLFVTHYYICAKLFTCATIIISGFTMYGMMKEITKKKEIALIGALIYLLIPYRLETIYNRFAIGEFSAYMFFPLLFQGLYNLLNGDGKKNYYIAISGVGLILTHTISTEYSVLLAILYMILNIKKLKNIEVWKKIGINLLIIITLTAFYTMPIIEHKLFGNYTIFDSTSMRSLPSDLQNASISITQLFKDTTEPEGVDFNLEIPLVLFAILGIFVFKKISEDLKPEYLKFLLIAVISLYMTNKLFPWIIMPNVLTTLQFPWRMLAFFEFALSVLCAINIYTLIEVIAKNKELLRNILFTCFIVIISISMAKVNYNYKYEAKKTLSDEEFEKKRIVDEPLSIWSINREYLPLNMDKDYIEDRENSTIVLQGQAEISNEQKNGLNLEFDVENVEEGTVLELPYIYYLGYQAEIQEFSESNDSIIEIKSKTFESENHFVAIKLGNNIQKAHIVVKYKGTIVERVGYIISGLSTVIIIVICIIKKRKDKKNEGRKA